MTGAGHRPRFGRARSRVGSRRTSHSYGYLLLMISVSFVFAATAPDADWATGVLVLLQSATMVVALWASGLTRAESPVNAGLLLVAVALGTADIIHGGSTLDGVLSIVSGVLTVATAVVIALSVVDRGEINRQSITGAICVYILLGMVAMFVYGAVAALGSGPFFAQGTDGTRAIRLYFSYVTLATLGYGDYTPAGNLGHALAVIEALLGQLYLVTVVALLVARVRPARLDDDRR
jgi:Ion channel